MEPKDIKELIGDLDKLLGLNGNFHQKPAQEAQKIETPSQLEDFARDLLVELIGLKVNGL